MLLHFLERMMYKYRREIINFLFVYTMILSHRHGHQQVIPLLCVHADDDNEIRLHYYSTALRSGASEHRLNGVWRLFSSTHVVVLA